MNKKWVLFIFFFAVLLTVLLSDASHYLSLEYLRTQHADLQLYYQQHPVLSLSVFCLLYISITSLCIPGANILTILAGGVFGLGMGTAVSSFCSAIGATLAFLGSRWIFRDYVQNRFSKYVEPFNKGIEQNGALYLFMLRLTPVVPYTVINLVMGITPMRPWLFYSVTQLGMLAATFVYANAGTHLGTIKGLQDIVTAKIFFWFLALAVLPFFLRKFSFMRQFVIRKRASPRAP